MKSLRKKYPSINRCGNILIMNSENYEKYVNVFQDIPDNEDYYVNQDDIIEQYRIERI